MQIFQENDDLRRVPVLLAGANCTGDEASLADCPGNGLNVDTFSSLRSKSNANAGIMTNSCFQASGTLACVLWCTDRWPKVCTTC